MSKLARRRKQRSVMVRLDLYEWILEQVKERRFWNFSHAVEVALIRLRELEKEAVGEIFYSPFLGERSGKKL